MVLGGEDAGVKEHQGQDQPEHELRLADVLHCPLVLPVPSKNNSINQRKEQQQTPKVHENIIDMRRGVLHTLSTIYFCKLTYQMFSYF